MKIKSINKEKIIFNAIMMFVSLFYLAPLWYILNNGFKKTEFISTDPFTIGSKSFTLDNIINAFRMFEYPRTFINSLIILALSCAWLVVLGSLAAYGITYANNRLMNGIYTFLVAIISVPFQIAMVPLIVLLKHLNLMNSYLGASFIYAAMFLPFVIFLYTGFMRTVPREMSEAAEIDGCGAIRSYLYVYMPLLKTITGIVIIIRGVGIWNDLLIPLIVMYKDSMYTLPLKLSIFATSLIGKWDIIFGGTILASLPITILFLLMQKSFIKGIMAGGIKG